MKKSLIFVICLFIGIATVISMRSVGGRMLYVSAKSITDYKTEIKGESAELKRIKQLVKKTEKKIDEYNSNKSEIEKKAKIFEDLKKEIELYKIASGKQSVEGQGIIITIDDGSRDIKQGEDINNVLVHDEDIMELINSLNCCNAEAIAVNDERVTDRSAITCNGYTIRINGQFHARPFVIKAIGDPIRFSENLLAPEGYGTKLKGYGVKFNLKVSDKLRIDKYDEEQQDVYSSVIKEGVK